MSEEPLDRFARGELSSAESRELARKALDDPELFDELTYASIARTGLARNERRNPWPRVAWLAAAAVLIALVSIYGLRLSRPAPPRLAVLSGPPTFLSPAADPGAVFRGAEPGSRAPRAMGSVTSTADGLVTIDLGSLDGLAKGGEVEVIREGATLGTIKLTTIFRERARAEAPAAIRTADQVRVPPAMYLRAVLEQIAALSARGDSAGALHLATEAAGAATVDMSATGYEDLNNLGGIAQLRGDRTKAQSLYAQALQANPPAAARTAIEANLARVRSEP